MDSNFNTTYLQIDNPSFNSNNRRSYIHDLLWASQRRYHTKGDILAQAEFVSQIFGVVA
ncbi:hypothetical protein [Scytonema sp. NUACC26]|uniref:hypothetical protein n=1 Tax=Scytonema sp. NUACC26 TaxID=3140176 RepID=UPI0038B33B80